MEVKTTCVRKCAKTVQKAKTIVQQNVVSFKKYANVLKSEEGIDHRWLLKNIQVTES